MTIMDGTRVMVAPCCGAGFALPPYASMNFLASEYWTDGWREKSLMPNDSGLRRCRCGQFILLSQMTEVGSGDDPSLLSDRVVAAAKLPEAIAQATCTEVEAAARLQYWWHLNHRYRRLCRQHTQATEVEAQAVWAAENPDRRTWWDKVRGQHAPRDRSREAVPVTGPAFEATDRQLRNMARLSEILAGWVSASKTEYATALVELYRQQGRFDEADQAIQRWPDSDGDDPVVNLIAELTRRRWEGPAWVQYLR